MHGQSLDGPKTSIHPERPNRLIECSLVKKGNEMYDKHSDVGDFVWAAVLIPVSSFLAASEARGATVAQDKLGCGTGWQCPFQAHISPNP